MRRLGNFFRTHKTFIISIGFLVLFAVTISYATPPTSPYAAGTTLDPNCAPTTTNCTVAIGGGGSSQWDTVTGGINFTGGFVGVGTTTPSTELDLEGDGGILAQGTLHSGITVPNLGAGTRLEWIPSAGAFRAGEVTGTQWNAINVGDGSTAFGFNAIASGNDSAAFGESVVASGDDGIAFGEGTVASGDQSTAFGTASTASGQNSTAFGVHNIADAFAGIAFGIHTTADSYASTVLGYYNIGGGTPTSIVEADPLFEVGDGDSVTHADALSVLKNGNVGINTVTPQSELDLEGDGAIIAVGTPTDEGGTGIDVPDLGAGTRLEWIPSESAFMVGTVTGTDWNSANVGEFSVALGYNETASGDWGIAIGDSSVASGDDSTVFGYHNIASGEDSTAFGQFTTASSYGSASLGQFNVDGGTDPLNWVGTDPLFEIGNGINSGSLADALMILKNGDTGIGLDPSSPNPSFLLQVGSSAVSGVVARFQNSTGTCDINPTTSSLTCSSDMRLKDNVTNLADNTPWSFNTNITFNNQSVLNKVLALNPVDYNWDTEASGASKHPGFIAQEVQQVFPDLVATDPTTGLLSLNYTGLIPYTVAAVQEMNLNVKDIDDLTRPNDWRDSLLAWFGDVNNGITNFFSTEITSVQDNSQQVNTNKLCVGTVCATQQQFLQMMQNAGQSSTPSAGTSPDTDNNDDDTLAQSPIVTPPVVTPPDDSSSDTSGPTQSPEVTDPVIPAN